MSKMKDTIFKVAYEVVSQYSSMKEVQTAEWISIANEISQKLSDQYDINCASDGSKANDYLCEVIAVLKRQI